MVRARPPEPMRRSRGQGGQATVELDRRRRARRRAPRPARPARGRPGRRRASGRARRGRSRGDPDPVDRRPHAAWHRHGTGATARPDPVSPSPPVRSRESGQASVELVVLAPLLVAIVLAAAQLLAAGSASELAGHASQAGAVALLEGEDPRAAARAAVPRWSRKRMDVSVRGRSVRVRLRPSSPIPGMADLLAASSRADAGPAPR